MTTVFRQMLQTLQRIAVWYAVNGWFSACMLGHMVSSINRTLRPRSFEKTCGWQGYQVYICVCLCLYASMCVLCLHVRVCVCLCVCVCVFVCVCLSSLVCMVGVIFVYVDTVYGFY